MDFTQLIGQTFIENNLYEILQFEIETNFESYFGKYVHIYFDSLGGNQIKVTGVVHFQNEDEFYVADKAMRGKRDLFCIYENHGHIDMLLHHVDLSGRISVIRKDHTFVQEGGFEYLEDSDYKPMTPDEMRLAFQELAELLGMQVKGQSSKAKKAV